MAISYKKLFDLLEANGWTTYKIRQEKLIGQGTLTALKNGTGGLDSKTISRICERLHCHPGDLMEYTPYNIFKYYKTQIMVSHQELSDAIQGIDHNEQFFSQSARSAIRNFLIVAKEAFNKNLPLGFYSYMSPDAIKPEEQEYQPKMLVYKPEDLWVKLKTYVHNKKTQDWLENNFHESFPECKIDISEYN